MHATHRHSTRRPLRLAAAALALLAGLAAGSAHAVLEVIEQAIETNTEEVRLPQRAPASVSVAGCTKWCPPTVRFTAQTTYFIGARPVTLAALNQYVSGRKAGMTIAYDPKTNVVNRVIAD